MHKITKLFVLTILSVMTAPCIGFADNSGGYQGQMPSNPQQQNPALNPNMSREDAFMRAANNRSNQMQWENRNMYTQDNRMMREGYDPNQGYPDFRGQGQMMPGNTGQFSQEHDPMGGNAMPQSYPLEGDYSGAPSAYQDNQTRNGNAMGWNNQSHAPIEYTLGRDGKWHNVSQNNPQRNGQQPSYYDNSFVGLNEQQNPDLNQGTGDSGDNRMQRGVPKPIENRLEQNNGLGSARHGSQDNPNPYYSNKSSDPLNNPPSPTSGEKNPLGLNDQAQHPVYEYMLGKDGKWHNVSQNNISQNNFQRNNQQPSNYGNPLVGMTDPQSMDIPTQSQSDPSSNWTTTGSGSSTMRSQSDPSSNWSTTGRGSSTMPSQSDPSSNWRTRDNNLPSSQSQQEGESSSNPTESTMTSSSFYQNDQQMIGDDSEPSGFEKRHERRKERRAGDDKDSAKSDSGKSGSGKSGSGSSANVQSTRTVESSRTMSR